LGVEREQLLADRLIERTGLRAVVKKIEPRVLAVRSM
jgi:hypothetical protein